MYLLSVVRLIACKDARLFEAFSCPWTLSLTCDNLPEIERLRCAANRYNGGHLSLGVIAADVYPPTRREQARDCPWMAQESVERPIRIWWPSWLAIGCSSRAARYGAAARAWCVQPREYPVWSKNSNALFSQSLRSHHRLLHILHPTYLYLILTPIKGHRL